MRLSKNFVLSEITRSNTAKRLNIDNAPDKEHLRNMQRLITNLIQPMRNALGPIRISSGYRSPALNRAIGGSNRSQHCQGRAIDIDDTYRFKTNAEMFQYIKDNLDFDQLIWEFGTDTNPDWVHASYVSPNENRRRCLKAKRKYGKAVYSII